MRISTIKGDSGYNLDAASRAYVFLNGEEVAHCFMADEERGEVLLYLMSPEGRYVRDLENQGIMCERKTGEVKIVLGDYPSSTPEEGQE